MARLLLHNGKITPSSRAPEASWMIINGGAVEVSYSVHRMAYHQLATVVARVMSMSVNGI